MSNIDGPNPEFARLRFARLVLWPAIASAVLFIIARIPPISSGGAVFTGAAYVFYGVLLLAALNACRRAGVKLPDIFGPLPRDLRIFGLPIFVAFLLLMFAGLSLWLTVFLASTVAPAWASELLSRRERSTMAELFHGSQRTLFVANVVLFGPFVEEFVFRGMLLRRWVETRGIWTGVLGSAAVFAILHPPSWLGAFATGIVLSVYYLWSRSLVIPVMIHVFYNGIIALIVLAPIDGAPSSSPAALNIDMIRSQWVAPSIGFVLTAALVAAVIVPLLRQVRERRALAAQGA